MDGIGVAVLREKGGDIDDVVGVATPIFFIGCDTATGHIDCLARDIGVKNIRAERGWSFCIDDDRHQGRAIFEGTLFDPRHAAGDEDRRQAGTLPKET